MDEEALRRLLDEERSVEAAAARGRARRLREQAAEEGTLAGTLTDLREQGAAVVLRTTGGRAHHGVVAGLGADFCALRLHSGRWVWVAWLAVASIRTGAGLRADVPGTRATVADRTLGEVLAALAPERPRVTVRLAGHPDPVSGELRAVGRDVLCIRLDGPGRAASHLALAAVTEVAVDAD